MLAKTNSSTIAALCAVGVMVLLTMLSVPKSLTGDEALTVTLAGESFSVMLDNLSKDIHMPGYYTLLWMWMKVFGNSLASLRVFAFIPVGALVFLGSRRLGKWSFLLLGTSPFLLHLAGEIRMYGLLALLGYLVYNSLKRYADAPSRGRYGLLAIWSALSVWTHVFAWPFVAGASLFLFWKKKWQPAVLLPVLCLIALTPAIPGLLRQVVSFAPAAGDSSHGLAEGAPVTARIAGMPFSIAGTLLRFSAGNAVFSFNLFSLGGFSFQSAAGFLLFFAVMASVMQGVRKTPPAAWFLMACVFLPLSFLRPSARHFAMTYSVFAAMAARGMDSGKLSKALRTLVPILSILVCLPFTARTTMPQRCTFDRDFREAAESAGQMALNHDIPLVIYLDNYSTMGVIYHLSDEGYGETNVWHPYQSQFSQGNYFFLNPEESLSFLMENTDSLIQTWGGDIILLANDPEVSRGPLYGTTNRIIGRGSDVMADLDLRESLEENYSLEKIPLEYSEGPFSLFLVRSH